MWLDVREHPEYVEGLAFFAEERKFLRWREDEIAQFPQKLQTLLRHPVGGQIRFVTDSEALRFRARTEAVDPIFRMPPATAAGFDLYVGSGAAKRFHAILLAEDIVGHEVDTCVALPPGTKEVTINLPVYGEVRGLALELDGAVTPAPAFLRPRLMLYGSSITQGYGVSRPGMGYAAVLGRLLDCPVYNFGFAGGAKGGAELGHIFGGISAGAFVYDYDHNAESLSHLAETHAPFFEAFRAQQPDTPVVMLSRPDFDEDVPYSVARRAVIQFLLSSATAFRGAGGSCCGSALATSVGHSGVLPLSVKGRSSSTPGAAYLSPNIS